MADFIKHKYKQPLISENCDDFLLMQLDQNQQPSARAGTYYKMYNVLRFPFINNE